MVGLGTIFIALMGLAAFLLWRGLLVRTRWLLWILMLAFPFPYIATTAGWMTAELGRQPWLVYGLLRTRDGTSQLVHAGDTVFTSLGFAGIFVVLGFLFLYLIMREIAHGPVAHTTLTDRREDKTMEALWFWLVSVMVAIYAVMDGFDFGAGILHPLVARTDAERRQVLGAIGPLWDGNEVWLLAGGGSLFLAFPKVLAAGFSGFYLALFMVIWTLIMRGIAIELRSHVADRMWRGFWDFAFTAASVLLPILLGAALGNVVRGVPIDDSGYFSIPLFTDFGTGNPVGILDWYTVLMGVFVLVTIANHGALFLAWKTEGPVHERARKAALPLSVLTAVLGGLATLATARVNPEIYANLPGAPLAWLGLAIFALGLCLVFWGQLRGKHLHAFVGSGAFILGLLAATAACMFPVMLKSTLDPAWSLTAHNAAASAHGLRTGLKWWLLGFPIVLAYFVLLFRLHRGKVKAEADGGSY